MTDIATNEPFEIIAGDLIQWKRQLSDYPANAGWSLSYTLINSALKITINTSADGADHAVSESATTSAGWTAGTYNWQARVTKGSEKYVVDEGTIIIKPNFAALTTFDSRTHVKKVLDAIEACIEGTASKDQEEYTIGTRSLKRRSLSELLTLREKYRGYWTQEQNAEKLKNGLGRKNKILVRL
ncbi:MAG: hypothetical protein SFX19_10105 [Alphaproteobacteria bacterium]|nr:hypothetical protein [Alphaproteobacteria bacterium]